MPEGPTPTPDDARERALKSLDEQLKAFEAKRAPPTGASVGTRGFGDGYRLLAGMISGVLGGLGLGWFVDRLAHTSPIGLISGLLIGTVASIVSVVVSASRMSAQAAAKSGIAPAAAPDTDDDE